MYVPHNFTFYGSVSCLVLKQGPQGNRGLPGQRGPTGQPVRTINLYSPSMRVCENLPTVYREEMEHLVHKDRLVLMGHLARMEM